MTDLTSLFTDLVRAETRLYNLVDARLRTTHDMTLGSLQFLRIISRGETCRVYDIAREVDITVGATSKAVDRLEGRGWCERRANPGDRRSSLLFLTAEGAQALTEAMPTFESAMGELVQGLSPSTVDQLSAGLRDWRNLLEGRAPDPE